MTRVELKSFEGNNIVYLDFSGLNPDTLPEVLKEAVALIRSQPEDSLYTLTTVDGAHFNEKVVQLLKEFAKGNERYVKMGAIVGLEGLQRLVLTAVSKFTGRNFIVCDSVDEAQRRLADS